MKQFIEVCGYYVSLGKYLGVFEKASLLAGMTLDYAFFHLALSTWPVMVLLSLLKNFLFLVSGMNIEFADCIIMTTDRLELTWFLASFLYRRLCVCHCKVSVSSVPSTSGRFLLENIL